MDMQDNYFTTLPPAEFSRLSGLGNAIEVNTGSLVFCEGDDSDSIYLIDSGQVAISIQKFTANEEVSRLGPGDFFGEMGLLSEQHRNATAEAITDLQLKRVRKSDFLDLVTTDQQVAEKIHYLINKRSEELLLRENLIDTTGVHRKHLHVSIKGDPSLRESTFTRQRYTSVVDPILAELEPVLADLLLNRNIFQIFVGFNNGEVRTSSIFDPFSEELHPANKLIQEDYIERHFPLISFDKKIALIKRTYQTLCSDPYFDELPEGQRKLYSENRDNLSQGQITDIVSRIQDLRDLPDFYLRNFAINLTKGTIRMQFNCDGTHIVSPGDYQKFLNDNLC